jgi:hypothetical protein
MQDWVLIKESYGSLLGAHIYDSALTLSDYLHSSHLSSHQGDVIVELGAGCGLVGLTCLHHSHHVVFTDKREQLELLRENILTNAQEADISKWHCLELDWSRSEHFQSLLAILTPYQRDGHDILLLAADVLYDAEYAVIFLSMLHFLLLHLGNSVGQQRGCVCSYVAQKNRQHQPVETLQYQWESVCVKHIYSIAAVVERRPKLVWKCVQDIMQVIVWKIELESI